MSRLTQNVRSPGKWRGRRPAPRRAPSRFAGRPRPSRHIPTRSGASPSARYLLRRLLTLPLRLLRVAARALLSRRILGKLIIAGLMLVIAGAAFLTIAIAALSRNLPAPGKLIERTVPISTKIFDREGKTMLYDLSSEVKRTPIALADIAPHAIDATLVAEDRGFYTHAGFDVKGIVRSAFLNVLRGGPLRGGSTITQQFVKNAVLTREKTLTRKLKELVLAYRIEKRFSKDEILNMYFNEIPYGSTLYGIEAASQSFFQKSAKDLDPLEGAILAAIPKAPSRLSPHGSHTDELTARVRHIIKGMEEEGYLDRETALRLIAEDPLSRIKPKREAILAPHFVFYVRELLAEKFGEDFVEHGGLKVITSLDFDLQKIAEEEVLTGALQNEKNYGGRNAALLALDVNTGQILAMVGSRDYFDETVDGNVNVTLRARQPGSSFKPIVYAAAFAKGFTPDTLIWDVVTTFKAEPKEYTPHNYDDKERGLIALRSALAGSLNIPAVKLIYLTGIDRVLDLAELLGYTTLRDRSRFGLSLVLGGGEVKLLEHVNAFAAFARSGEFLPHSALLRIEDSSGRILEQWRPPRKIRAVDEAVARDITDILADNSARAFMFGAQNYLTLKDRPVAAKTGTTNDFHDAWAVGFTPAIAAGVWVGNNDNAEMKAKADGSQVAAPIWNAFMRRAHEIKKIPAEDFPKPNPQPVSNPILRGQGMGEVLVKINRVTGERATSDTAPELVEERVYQTAHSLLFYLDKDNLSLPPPENPGADPNFENWEEAIRRYAEEHGLRAEPPPTKYDVAQPASFPDL